MRKPYVRGPNQYKGPKVRKAPAPKPKVNMNIPVYNMMYELNVKTLPMNDRDTRQLTKGAIAARIFRPVQYVKDAHCDLRTAVPDISFITLIVAHIFGMWLVNKRAQSRLAALDVTLELDREFYMGLWDIVSLCRMGTITPHPVFLKNFEAFEDVYYSKETDIFSIRNEFDVYQTFLYFKGQKITSDGFSTMFSLDHKYLGVQISKHRPDSFERTLGFYMNCVYYHSIDTIAPDGFWERNINMSLLYLQKCMINFLYLSNINYQETKFSR